MLEEAPYGISHADVLERAGNPIAKNTLATWLQRGRRDNKQGKYTAYGIFASQWDALFVSKKRSISLERARMHAITRALEELGIEMPKEGELDDAMKQCECGKRRPATALACNDCLAIEIRMREVRADRRGPE